MNIDDKSQSEDLNHESTESVEHHESDSSSSDGDGVTVEKEEHHVETHHEE